MFEQVKIINRLFSKQKMVTIEMCEKNLERFLNEENFSDYNTFFTQKHIEFKEFECLSMCKECKLSPYALLNGEFIAAKDSVELLEKLKDS